MDALLLSGKKASPHLNDAGDERGRWVGLRCLPLGEKLKSLTRKLEVGVARARIDEL